MITELDEIGDITRCIINGKRLMEYDQCRVMKNC